VKQPEEALAAARRAAASAPDASADQDASAPWSPEGSAVSARRLAEWAIIEPDESGVRSTRPRGRPITALKLLLVRLLRQYIGQMTAQQSRFNAQVAAHVVRLEERVAELEKAARRDREGPGAGAPPSA
jgi:hypothetical protein